MDKHPATAAQALTWTLRDLGLRARAFKPKDPRKPTLWADFSVHTKIIEGHYRRTGERITDFVYASVLTMEAHKAIIANQAAIVEQMHGYGYKCSVDVHVSESTGNHYASLGTY